MLLQKIGLRLLALVAIAVSSAAGHAENLDQGGLQAAGAWAPRAMLDQPVFRTKAESAALTCSLAAPLSGEGLNIAMKRRGQTANMRALPHGHEQTIVVAADRNNGGAGSRRTARVKTPWGERRAMARSMAPIEHFA
jgi:hypothetical protein